jgi:hypothetical protein
MARGPCLCQPWTLVTPVVKADSSQPRGRVSSNPDAAYWMDVSDAMLELLHYYKKK